MPPAAKNLVDGSALFECAFRDHLRSHLFHVQHEGIQRLFNMWLPLLFLLNCSRLLRIKIWAEASRGRLLLDDRRDYGRMRDP